MGFPGGTSGKEPACQCRRHKEMWVWPLGWGDPLEEGMATHSSVLAWRIPRTEEPGGLQSMVSQRVGHDWSNLACAHVGDVFRKSSEAQWSWITIAAWESPPKREELWSGPWRMSWNFQRRRNLRVFQQREQHVKAWGWGGERFGENANCSAGVNSRGKSLLWLDPCLHFIPGYPRCLLSLLSEELSKLSSKAASLAVTQCVPLYLEGLEITLLKHSQHTGGTEETLSASVCLCWGGEGAEAERAGSDSFRRGQDMTPDPRVPGQTWGHTHTPEVASPWAPEGTAT